AGGDRGQGRAGGVRQGDVERGRLATVSGGRVGVGTRGGGGRVVVTDRVCRGAGNRGDADDLTGVGADLEVRALEGAVEQVHTVELRVGGNVVDVGGELLELRVEVGAVVGAVRRVER